MTEKNAHNPFDPEQFRMPNAFDGSGDGIRRELTHVRVGKPKKSSFFRSHTAPEYSVPVSIIEDDSGGMKDDYLVLPDVAHTMIEETKPKLLVFCVDKMGVPFLWLAPRVTDDGFQRPNLWNQTAFQALELSKERWVRMSANLHEGAYTIHTSDSATEPAWPELTMTQLIELGFGNDRVIRSVEHPVIKRLQGFD